MVKSGYIDVNDSKIFYCIEGEGTPCIIASYLGASSYRRMYSQNLRNHLQLIFNDLGGGGGESIPGNIQDISMDSLVEEIEALRKALELGKFVLIGHSGNLTIALEYAVKYPSHVSHLVLMALGPKFDSSGHTDIHWERYASKERRELLERKLGRLGDVRIFDDFVRWYAAHTPLFWRDPDFDVGTIFEDVRPNHGVLRRLFTKILGGYDGTSNLSNIKCPTLLIMGHYDFANPPSTWDDYRDQIPDCTYHILRDSGHNPMTELPEKFDEILVDWIKATQ